MAEPMTLKELALDLIEHYGNYQDLPMYISINGVLHPISGLTFSFKWSDEESYGEIEWETF